MDMLEKYVYEAHAIFDATSVFEVLDRDREYATAFLTRKYGRENSRKIEEYLKVIDKLKSYFETRRKAHTREAHFQAESA